MKAAIDQQLLVLWKPFQIRGIDGVHLLLRLLDGGSRFQTPNVGPRVVVPRVIRFLLFCERQRYPESCSRIDKLEVSRHHSDDGPKKTTHANLPSDDARIASITLLPQTITEDDLQIVAALSFRFIEDASMNRLDF